MPTNSVKAAKEWQAAHCPHAGIRTGNQGATKQATRGATKEATKGGNKTGNQTVELQVPLVDADGETLEESIERLRQIEKSLGVAVQQAAADGYSAELRQLQRDHINAVKALSDSEIRVMRLQQKRGELITVDEAKAMITKTLAPILVELRKLADQARDEAEKVFLSAIAERMLAKIRESAAEYVVCTEKTE